MNTVDIYHGYEYMGTVALPADGRLPGYAITHYTRTYKPTGLGFKGALATPNFHTGKLVVQRMKAGAPDDWVYTITEQYS